VIIAHGPSRADYGIALFIIGLTVTFAGQWAAHYLMTKLRRRSVVIFCMAALMCVCCHLCLPACGDPFSPLLELAQMCLLRRSGLQQVPRYHGVPMLHLSSWL